jgi:hypothetical protein
MVANAIIQDIIEISDKVTQVVIKVKHNNIFLNVCFIAFGDVKNKIKKDNIEISDRVRIKYYLKSKKWNEKYSTDAIIQEISIKEKGKKQMYVDLETGEVIYK